MSIEAMKMAVDYIHAALISHDNAYGNHPAMKRERDEIVRDLEALRQAIEQAEKQQRSELVQLTDRTWEWRDKNEH